MRNELSLRPLFIILYGKKANKKEERYCRGSRSRGKEARVQKARIGGGGLPFLFYAGVIG
jgi:hypothetical protein